EDVAAADDHPDLGPGLLRLDDLARQAPDDLGVDAVVLVAHQRLAGEFEQDAAIGKLRHGGLGSGKRVNSSGSRSAARAPRADPARYRQAPGRHRAGTLARRATPVRWLRNPRRRAGAGLPPGF